MLKDISLNYIRENPDMGFNKMDNDLLLQRIGVLVEDRMIIEL